MHARTKTQLKSMELRTLPTRGDGSCFYHALIEAISGNSTEQAPSTLREKLAQEILRQGVGGYDHVRDRFLQPEEYARDVRNNRWADSQDIHLLSNLLQVNIIVLYLDVHRQQHAMRFPDVTGSDLAFPLRPTVVLSNIPAGHFSLVSVNGRTILFPKDNIELEKIRELLPRKEGKEGSSGGATTTSPALPLFICILLGALWTRLLF